MDPKKKELEEGDIMNAVLVKRLRNKKKKMDKIL